MQTLKGFLRRRRRRWRRFDVVPGETRRNAERERDKSLERDAHNSVEVEWREGKKLIGPNGMLLFRADFGCAAAVFVVAEGRLLPPSFVVSRDPCLVYSVPAECVMPI